MKTNDNKAKKERIVKENNLQDPINPQEAQNVTDGCNRMSGKEAEHDRRKANEGSRQDRSKS